MAMRDLVMGGGACGVPDPSGASSSANPLGGFADSLLGTASKTQERLRELPGLAGPGQSSGGLGGGPLSSLPGSEFDAYDQSLQSNSDFLRSFNEVDQQGFAAAWGDATDGHMPPLDDFERIYRQGSVPLQPFNAPPQRMLATLLRTFLRSDRAADPLHPVPIPDLGLSQADKSRIRDRSCIMSRHIFAERGDEYVNAQVNALLQSLDIESDARFHGPMGGRHSELQGYWNESQMAPGKSVVADQWAQDFSQQYRQVPRPGDWAEEFHTHHNVDAWADQFGEHRQQMATRNQYRNGEMGNVAGLEETRSLVETLSQNQDPKFQNSKFLQFVSKMSRGEIIVEDNQVKPGVENSWANEYEQQHQLPGTWGSEFAREHQHRGDTWANEFSRDQEGPSTSDDWVNDFARLQVQDWADEFSDQVANNAYGDGSHHSWLDSYEKFVQEQAAEMGSSSSKWIYVFADQNPYMGHPYPLKEGQELFRRGLLSEAVLALEAEVMKNPENAEGWRLLGITHAENDDDKQAIASMIRARDADPTNLEVLLALGVGHTNELEQTEALRYLRGWLQHHPRYGSLVSPDPNEPLNHAEVTAMVNRAALMSPEDGDVHTVLGVLYNLSREYDRAIDSFQTALKLKPRDYSLWNKLGATQANSARSVDAIYAYQQALDLKPNYVRAWSNMGIGYANQGRYQESIRYYVRALVMNPKADNVWDYLRISLSSTAARRDMLDACESRQLDVLQKEYPL
ncbi:unnamed protein product [Calypogeia fissa]